MKTIYGCYHCGEMNGETTTDNYCGALECSHCHNLTVVSLPVALDLLRDQEIKGLLHYDPEDYLDEMECDEQLQFALKVLGEVE